MINKLKKKIFWGIELSAMGLLLTILIIINAVNFYHNDSDDKAFLNSLLNQTVTSDLSYHESGSYFDNNMFRRYSDKRPELIGSIVSSQVSVIKYSTSSDTILVSGFASDWDTEKLKKVTNDIVSSHKLNGGVDGTNFAARYYDSCVYIALMNSGLSQGEIRLLIISLAGFIAASFLFAILAELIAKNISGPVSEAFAAQRRFIADISHELKTPVAVMKADISVLEKQLGENKWLNYIKCENDRLTGLIIDMLKISKIDYEIETGSDDKSAETFNLSHLISGCVLSFEAAAFEKNIQIAESIPKNIFFQGIKDDILTIMQTLVENALKHTPKKGCIKISLVKKERVIDISISNSGDKIPDTDIPFIFDRFYKADQARKYDDGFGLGLSIAQALAKKSDGNITVSSNDDNTTFTLILPYNA